MKIGRRAHERRADPVLRVGAGCVGCDVTGVIRRSGIERPAEVFEPLGIALPPNDPLLVNWTQNELADLDDSGTIYDMMYSWFEEDDWVTRLK